MERYYIRCLSAGRKWKICVCNREIFGFDGQNCLSSAASLAEHSIQHLLYEIFLRPSDLRCVFTIAMAWEFRLMNLTSWEVEQPRVFAAAAGLNSSNCRKSSASASNAGKSGCLWLTSIFLFFNREFHCSLAADFLVFSIRNATARLVFSLPIAIVLFWFWLLASLAWPIIPVGMCVITIAVSTLFRCCPPGPLARVRFTEQSLSSNRSDWLAGCWGTLFIRSIINSWRWRRVSLSRTACWGSL